MILRHQILTAVRPSVVAWPRQLSQQAPKAKPANSKLPEGVIHEPTHQFDPPKPGFLDAVDRLGNAMFMGEIFRGIWLSLEV